MIVRRRWDRCVSHRGAAVTSFVREHFGQPHRHVKLIAGAGFDPRSTQFSDLLASTASDRISGVFLREQRPSPRADVLARADENERRMRELIPSCTVESFDIFDIDIAPVGGRRATSALSKCLDLAGVTDLILDCSALSVGVFFPIAKYCYERITGLENVNFHLVVLDNPKTDSAIHAETCGKPGALHTYQGGLNLDSSTDAARLWLPQLGPKKREVLKLVHQFVKPHAVCPILPFPALHPRSSDELIEEYGDLFETISDPFEFTWQVDARDLVYANEKSPVDLYWTILRIDDGRRAVFAATGGSQLILSPVGSKALSLGILMAALERDFAVVSVEPIAYKVDAAVYEPPLSSGGELVHIWLHGEAYVRGINKEVSSL